MLLSEALRLGEFALKPIHLEWITSVNGVPCAGCAVGRACIAAGYKVTEDSESIHNLSPFFDKMWPWTAKYRAGKAVGFEKLNHVLQEISQMYESRGLSIQRIADYVETLEKQYDI